MNNLRVYSSFSIPKKEVKKDILYFPGLELFTKTDLVKSSKETFAYFYSGIYLGFFGIFKNYLKTDKYFLFLFLISQHLLILLQNNSRIIIKLNLQFLFSSNKFFSLPLIPQLLNHRMIFFYHQLMKFLLEVSPSSVIRLVMNRQILCLVFRVGIFLH